MSEAANQSLKRPISFSAVRVSYGSGHRLALRRMSVHGHETDLASALSDV